METWKPITKEQLESLIASQLLECTPELQELFERYRVPPFSAPLRRNGLIEDVYVVARRGDEVLYYEDVEEGFNISPAPSDGKPLTHWCNQDDLQIALLLWAGKQA